MTAVFCERCQKMRKIPSGPGGGFARCPHCGNAVQLPDEVVMIPAAAPQPGGREPIAIAEIVDHADSIPSIPARKTEIPVSNWGQQSQYTLSYEPLPQTPRRKRRIVFGYKMRRWKSRLIALGWFLATVGIGETFSGADATGTNFLVLGSITLVVAIPCLFVDVTYSTV